MNYPTPHIKAKPEDFGKTVLMQELIHNIAIEHGPSTLQIIFLPIPCLSTTSAVCRATLAPTRA